MNKKLILIASLCVNVALAGGLWYAVSTRTDTDAQAAELAKKQVAAKQISAPKDKEAKTAGYWRELNSKEPESLLANLRAAGFPPKVIRAIMAAAISDMFEQRRRELFGDNADIPFWKMRNADTYALSAKMQILQREQHEMLKKVLGGEYTAAIEDSAWYWRRQYGNLSPEKLETLQRVTRDYSEMRMQILADANGVYLPEDRDKLAMIEKEQRADLASVLTPQELAEFEMRSSSTAQRMRSQLSAFDFTEQEFKDVFGVLSALDQKYNTNIPGLSGDTKLYADRRAAEQAAQSQIKELLGEQRYQDYQKATNGFYRVANQIATRLNLPASAADQVFATSQSSEQQARSIMSNRDMSQEAKTQSLQGLAKDIDAKLNQFLTPKGAEAFKANTNSGWMRYLNPQQTNRPGN